mmetsp:Transcript_95613/g.298106  ORF Transcript_95613/g.298106 Transcript_95613/m.298106 type:complete len:300 (-) Transcript_95613:110-1009(-)
MAGLFSRAFGGGSSLEVDLKRVTESGVIEVPKDLLSAVVRASYGEEERREIMRHLRQCLAEPNSMRWRRVYSGLLLVEDLMKNGSRDLLTETAEGHHFDLVQRLSLLEQFECTTDKRVQNMVRAKAKVLRDDLLPRLQTAHDAATVDAGRECTSTCSPGTATSSCSTSSTSAGNTSPKSGTPGAPWKPEGQMVLNGIVAVGHRDDTTSESSGEEAPRAVAFRKARKGSQKSSTKSRRPHAHSDDSTDSDDVRREHPQRCNGVTRSSAPAECKIERNSAKAPMPAVAPTPAAQPVDLLDL